MGPSTMLGRLVAVWGDDKIRLGRAIVGTGVRQIDLTALPEAKPGDYIEVERDIGVAVISDEAARRVLAEAESIPAD